MQQTRLTKARPTPAALGEMMGTLRRRARMSQRELARLCDVSYTQIGDLERGQGGFPSPLTLRSIAKGLATDAFLEQGYDPIRADACYRQLMDAAGYLGGLPVDAPPKRTDEDDVVGYLTRKTSDLAVAELLVRVAEKWPELSAEDQVVAKHLLTGWVRD